MPKPPAPKPSDALAVEGEGSVLVAVSQARQSQADTQPATTLPATPTPDEIEETAALRLMAEGIGSLLLPAAAESDAEDLKPPAYLSDPAAFARESEANPRILLNEHVERLAKPLDVIEQYIKKSAKDGRVSFLEFVSIPSTFEEIRSEVRSKIIEGHSDGHISRFIWSRILEVASLRGNEGNSKEKFDSNEQIIIARDVDSDSVLENYLRGRFNLSAERASEVRSFVEILIQNFVSGEPGSDPRFAHIERWSTHRRGEDAIQFYQRAWADAPQPVFRDNISLHDPDLIAAVSDRCRNLNRDLQPGQMPLRVDDILPPRKPASKTAEARRETGRKRQARTMSRLKAAEPY